MFIFLVLEGGFNLSQDNAVFSFELNESLYFEQGQEVAEILGISLDPEISIQPFNDYISIRGVIELNGEYQRAMGGETTEDHSFNLDDYSTRRYVEQVVDAERGEATFSHRFPVEISVPTYRVNDLNDVTVSVDYFDYEIPDQNQIRLKSIIAIQGINDIAVAPEKPEYDEVIERQEDVVSLEKNDTFRFDIKKQEDPLDVEGVENQELESRKEDVYDYDEIVEDEPAPAPLTFEKKSEPVQQVEAREDEIEQEEEKHGDTPSSFVKFTEEPAQTEQQVPTREDDFQQEAVVEEQSVRSHTSSVKASEDDELEESSEGKVDYLSDLFREDDEKYSKMRLCIVQDNETIDTIAERYQVSPLHLTKQNHLEDEIINEGQLLFIPEK